MSVLNTFKRLLQEDIVDLVTVDGKISAKDKKWAHDLNSLIDDTNNFLAVMDAMVAHNTYDHDSLFRLLVDAIEEEDA